MITLPQYLNSIWHGAGAFAVVTFLQQLEPLAVHWINGTHFVLLAPIFVSLFSVLTQWAKNQEVTT